MIKRIRNTLILLLCSVVTGTLLLMLVFALPVEPARRHVETSLYAMIEIKEDPGGSAARKEIVGLKENFTDSLMVQNALEKVEGKTVLEHAMYVYHYDIQDETETTWLTEESLVRFLRQGEEGLHLREYSKYWHGYLVYLKPLLLLLSWEHVEIFLLVIQVLFLIFIVFLSFQRKKGYLGLGIVCAFLFMKPLRIWMSLAMSVCWGITLVAVMVLLLCYDRIEKKNWREEVFLLIGILTAYLDFLTYPVVTLGIPLCVWLLLRQDADTGEVWYKRCMQIFWICACWAVGYAGMWGMKWVTAELTCQTGTLRNAVWSIITRAEPLDGYESFFSGAGRTVRAVLGQYDAVWYGVFFGLLAASVLVSGIWCLVKARNLNWGFTMGALAITALFPVGWLLLTQNHTAIHCIFTFRILGVSIMALWCMTVSSILTIRRKTEANGGKEK